MKYRDCTIIHILGEQWRVTFPNGLKWILFGKNEDEIKIKIDKVLDCVTK